MHRQTACLRIHSNLKDDLRIVFFYGCPKFASRMQTDTLPEREEQKVPVKSCKD